MNPLVIWNGLIAICTVATTLYATQRVGTNVVPKYQSLGPPTNLTIGFLPSLDGKYLLDGPSDGLIDQPDSLGGFGHQMYLQNCVLLNLWWIPVC